LSRQWTSLVSQLCTPSQQFAVWATASARSGDDRIQRATTADAALLARFGMTSRLADAWACGVSAAPVLCWPENVLDLVEPVGLFEGVAVDEVVVVLERLAWMASEPDDAEQHALFEALAG
jgi:hypothetical protein